MQKKMRMGNTSYSVWLRNMTEYGSLRRCIHWIKHKDHSQDSLYDLLKSVRSLFSYAFSWESN